MSRSLTSLHSQQLTATCSKNLTPRRSQRLMTLCRNRLGTMMKRMFLCRPPGSVHPELLLVEAGAGAVLPRHPKNDWFQESKRACGAPSATCSDDLPLLCNLIS